jgi:hypothetical protein
MIITETTTAHGALGGCFPETDPFEICVDYFPDFTITILPIGGEILLVDSSALLLAGASVNAYWIIPAFVGIAGAALLIGKRRLEK